MEDVLGEVKRLLAGGSRVAIIAYPGWGKTTVLIPSAVELLARRGRVVITTPYHEVAKLLYRILSAKYRVLHVAGGHELCLGELQSEFPYVHGFCKTCLYYSVALIPLPSDPEQTVRAAQEYRACPYASQLAAVERAEVVVKTHRFAPPKNSIIIADEVHALWLGRLIVTTPTQYCDMNKEEVLRELVELKERCFKCIREVQWFGKCNVGANCDVDKIALLEEIANGECKNVEDGAVIRVRYPRHDGVVLAATATPPRRIPRGFEVVEVLPEKKPTLIVVENVRTTLRDFDPAQWNSLLEYLRSAHGGLAVAAPARVLMQTPCEMYECFEIWGRMSHGVTILQPAIVAAEPWLSYIAYQLQLGGDPQIALELTLIQLVQVLARVRPWSRDATLYAVGPLALRHEDYFGRLFAVEVAVWDGVALRKI